MRMWKLNPEYMCRQHLLGEHLEMHMFLGCFKLGKNIDGYVKNQLVEVHNIKTRHDSLAKEMVKRGYTHKTEMENLLLPERGEISLLEGKVELLFRCEKCRDRLLLFFLSQLGLY